MLAQVGPRLQHEGEAHVYRAAKSGCERLGLISPALVEQPLEGVEFARKDIGRAEQETIASDTAAAVRRFGPWR
jgi:hypothetical protein